MRKLQIAFSKTEKGKRLLENLEELHQNQEVTEAQFDAMKSEYSTFLKEAETELETLQKELQQRHDTAVKEHERFKQELANLEIRIKVGELPGGGSQRQETRLRKQVVNLEAQVEELTRLIAASSSEDLGGHIDVPIQQGLKLGRRRLR
ncbi:CdvA-like protein [Candidatus Bipolaricaulota bacterium]|jgi:ElaB/YqjD/DUF883 family membrane-anchored ribosome-binding protein|nr:CdvA-like protein [Candidatus Bipolaricaulota bacterium]